MPENPPAFGTRKEHHVGLLVAGHLLGVAGMKYASVWWGIMQRNGAEKRCSYPAIVSE